MDFLTFQPFPGERERACEFRWRVLVEAILIAVHRNDILTNKPRLGETVTLKV